MPTDIWAADVRHWHSEPMSGKEIDRNRAHSALEVAKQHPAMVLFLAAPALIALGLVWWLASPGLAVLLLIGMLVVGGGALVLKRN